MASMDIFAAPETRRDRNPIHINVFWAFIAIIAVAALLALLMPAPRQEVQVGPSYPSATAPDVYIRAATDRRIVDTRRVKVTE